MPFIGRREKSSKSNPSIPSMTASDFGMRGLRLGGICGRRTSCWCRLILLKLRSPLIQNQNRSHRCSILYQSRSHLIQNQNPIPLKLILYHPTRSHLIQNQNPSLLKLILYHPTRSHLIQNQNPSLLKLILYQGPSGFTAPKEVPVVVN